ncbi:MULTISPECIES: hypothetical protein [Streptomyces]|uniref:hypothetical protein n=1 Tax=Streptomyces TaxID=1883 RepID=UPI0011650F7A|nr:MULTISPECIES: hypothetical protein [unclassified Streptomyces]NMI57799.1 hypothetical protein [Streptomyces sp. RLA2-12]QDN57138.1 hypothetical protein FNV67_18970 [Streptomyces sp. S1D4-20]QDN67313.1 hypothetical protein FNV66_18565 [Streptomyces sp. S1D4-14]QDN77580.1 hypothetical protein FNV64_19990 [Streptomyces sp. S1A1-7]QDO49722.1 hypothetical protein FNV60_16815 [Streptomyces sp. RLB3-5]
MSSRRTEKTGKANRAAGARGWNTALRTPWTVACAVVTVLVGPAAATASALDRANAAPPYHAHENHENHEDHESHKNRETRLPYVTPYATLPQSLKRSHSLG